MHKYKIITGSALLAVVSVLLQIYKIAFPYAGFIDIDTVGVPWLISTFLFGLGGGLITSVVSAIGIAVFAPSGPIGAVMKFTATAVMVIIVGVVAKTIGFNRKGIVVAFAACLVARPVLMVIFNYYIGIPLFFGMPTEVAMVEYPVELFLVPNAILATIDFWVAYLLVFKTKLKARIE
ncbi:MAG: hypothetical protein CL943_02595 [Candidatus Diapherotrites archaeon]|uniref:ECF transporter S component n=1 Tax=Candidatus Iainarchaeum sp. TaxID=3101447 RepID=A0A2D6M1A2_9ARCH|nr:hypothetical protein [Candidatus Diapherotrites archaeon]|tara:strand:+ start:686 stop:1219 length:534 start_codon:yes stop_codon:yes gene_type:complete